MARNKKNRPERQEWKIPAPLQILRGVLGGALSLVKIAVGGIVTVAWCCWFAASWLSARPATIWSRK